VSLPAAVPFKKTALWIEEEDLPDLFGRGTSNAFNSLIPPTPPPGDPAEESRRLSELGQQLAERMFPALNPGMSK
jgi:hypothetical protein